jgi:hypothetical protein
MAAAYPPLATAVPQQVDGQHAIDTGWFAALSDQSADPADPPAERTTVMPVFEADDDP